MYTVIHKIQIKIFLCTVILFFKIDKKRLPIILLQMYKSYRDKRGIRKKINYFIVNFGFVSIELKLYI